MRLYRVITASTVFTAGYSLLLWNSVYAQSHHDTTLQSLDQEVKKDEVCDSISKTSSEQPRVAIIGAGIGGSSATHFLRKLLGPSATIDVYEKSDRIGGRLGVITVNGETIEAGGTIIHSSNQYMVNFTKEMGLKPNPDSDDDKLGIYNGQKFVFQESTFSISTTLAMIWRYGAFSLWHMNSSLKKMLTDFQNIYKLQEDGQAFNTVPEMLRAMGGDYFYEYTQKTIREAMKENGIGDRLIEELVTAVDRCNYGQDMVNGFTGYVSLAGAQGGSLWNVHGGNYQVCQRLLKSADANVTLNSKINSIRREMKDNKPVYYLESKDKTKCSQPYDAVVIASPLEIPDCFIDCSKCSDWPNKKNQGKYHQTIASFIRANINEKYFGVDSKDKMPGNIFTTENESLPFLSIGPQRNVDGIDINPKVYKIFTRKLLADKDVNDIFDVTETSEGESPQLHSISWLAYPQYSPPEKFAPFKLDDGVFYVNAIERAASAMEMSSIGGRNAALLVKYYLQNKK